MVSLEWSVAERGGVTLVECRVENDAAVDRRVRVASRLDGPVWPPRREGLPEAGWDDGGYEGTVGAGETVALGFASPAPPADPPVEVAWSERSAAGSGPSGGRPDRPGETDADGPDEPSPADVLRALGDPRPPADAVPLPETDAADDAGHAADEAGRASTGADDAEPPPAGARPAAGGRAPEPSPEVPAAVGTWLEDAADRVDRAEALAAAEGVTDAARGLEAAGGLEAAAALVADLEGDARRLRRVAERAGALADRAEAAADAPVETLRRIA